MIRFIIIVFASIQLLSSCEKQVVSIKYESIGNYFPTQKGKSITYKLDSTIYSEVNATKTIHSYIIRDQLDTSITDNLGRINYVYKRSIRDQIDTTKWNLLQSYRVSVDSSSIELIEDNLRFIKLIVPLREGFSWKGNSFINTSTNALNYLEDWDYTYDKINEPSTINSISFASTITVVQRNDTIGSITDRKQYGAILVSKEIYAKETGLVYKEFLKETWQPPNSNNPNGYFEKGSYGIKLSVLSVSK